MPQHRLDLGIAGRHEFGNVPFASCFCFVRKNRVESITLGKRFPNRLQSGDIAHAFPSASSLTSTDFRTKCSHTLVHHLNGARVTGMSRNCQVFGLAQVLTHN